MENKFEAGEICEHDPEKNVFPPRLIKKFQNLETPFYYYDLELLRRTLESLQKSATRFGYKTHYALKANANDRILALVKEHGLGADCVSGNEVQKALDVGFPANDIVFAGVGKTDPEIRLALQHDIFCFNCESLQELEVIDELAASLNRTASVALRINPNIDAKTHRYITTGLDENKFGINVVDLQETMNLLQRLNHVRLIGLHFHIGSQITNLNVFKGLCVRVNEVQKWFVEHHLQLAHLNLGGGLGVDYQHPDDHAMPDFDRYFRTFHRFLEPLPNQVVHFEPGRALVAQCGSLISRVIFMKTGVRTNFAILDAGMTELIRPALYQSYHKIENLTSTGPIGEYDVVGPVCESSDCFGKAVSLPETQRGDLIAIRSTGAYGETMASRYNLRDLPRAVYSDDLG